MKTDHDSPWKVMLEKFFRDCMAILFPEIHAIIDWSRKVVSLDKELHRLSIHGRSDHRYVDKLFSVWLKDGTPRRIWMHIEVQSQVDAQFPRRMFFYWTTLFMDEKRAPLSLAILADDDPDWKPDQFDTEIAGCSVKFLFPVVKLLDFEARREEMEKSDNPILLLILAHLDTMATTGDPERRIDRKIELTRNLFRRGIGKERIAGVYRLLDWMMQLPDDFKSRWYNEVVKISEETNMPFVSTAEWVGEKKGLQKGLEKGLEKGLNKGRILQMREVIAKILTEKFGEQAEEFAAKVGKWSSIAKLNATFKSALAADSLESFAKTIESTRRR